MRLEGDRVSCDTKYFIPFLPKLPSLAQFGKCGEVMEPVGSCTTKSQWELGISIPTVVLDWHFSEGLYVSSEIR